MADGWLLIADLLGNGQLSIEQSSINQQSSISNQQL
jgi:hypothetical protein